MADKPNQDPREHLDPPGPVYDDSDDAQAVIQAAQANAQAGAIVEQAGNIMQDAMGALVQSGIISKLLQDKKIQQQMANGQVDSGGIIAQLVGAVGEHSAMWPILPADFVKEMKNVSGVNKVQADENILLKQLLMGPKADLSMLTGSVLAAYTTYQQTGKFTYVMDACAGHVGNGVQKAYTTLRVLTEAYGEQVAFAVLGMRCYMGPPGEMKDVQKLFDSSMAEGKSLDESLACCARQCYPMLRIFTYNDRPGAHMSPNECVGTFAFLLISRGLLKPETVFPSTTSTDVVLPD